MPRRTQQTKSEDVRLKRRAFRGRQVGRRTESKRDRWLQTHVGLWIKRPRGTMKYHVVGPDTIPYLPYTVEVVRLRRADGSEFTMGYPEAMEMVVTTPPLEFK